LSDDGLPYLDVADAVTNSGRDPFAPRIMYHMNFGAPLVLPGTRLEISHARPRLDGRATGVEMLSYLVPDIDADTGESVTHYSGMQVDSNGWSRCRIAAPSGLAIEVSWTAQTLPHVHQWSLTGRNGWALAIEPASDSLDAAQDLSKGAELAPGDVRNYAVNMRVVPPRLRG
jgi:hypothetical protein